MCSADRNFYFDFDSEIKLDKWDIEYQGHLLAKLRCRITKPAGNYIFAAPCFAAGKNNLPQLKSFSVNGKSFPVRRSDAVLVFKEFDWSRYGIEFRMEPGENLLEAEVSLPESGICNPDHLFFSLIESEPPPQAVSSGRKIHRRTPAETPARNREDFDPAGWKEGVGHKNSPGRFGFSKGDGLLDCAMPALGIVDKMFLSGQEKYRKPYRWNYSLLPEGMGLHASYAPKDTGIEQDDIQVNPLSVRWSAQHDGKRFTCTYSLASPAILCENEAGSMRLSNLRFAGNYQSVLIPREDGIEETALDEASIAGMAENWILLFNSTEFPDCPLMLVFDRNPAGMKVKRDFSGRLESIEFPGCPLMLSCMPFGIERFDPGKMKAADAVRRCRFWSRALLAYPVRCRDYFRLDEKNEKVIIRQKFEYRYLEDAWGTEPLELAPFPPPVSICGTAECSDPEDFGFPTKYGYLRGRIGCWSEYVLPFMPIARKFPLCDEHSDIPELLRDGMKEYQHATSAFGPEKISYPFAGAILESFAYASSMSSFMNEDDREFLRKHLSECLPAALKDDAQSDYTVVLFREMMQDHLGAEDVLRIYRDPAKKHIALRCWYDRIEPFTGAKFKICYLNVGFLSNGMVKTASPEEILNLKIPLIEIDWGVGMTFTYLYLSALAVGSFQLIRENWPLLKQVYSFFELMHDWACMGTGYSDNGISWVEGGNYGLFPAYIRMAEAAHDPEARDFGIYNAAKQLALRLAIIRSSQTFFPRYFEAEPWYCTKLFHEEASPDQAFQNVPELSENRLRMDAVYNFTTEGLFPEAYTALRKFGGDWYNETMKRLEDALLNNRLKAMRWQILEQFAGVMIDHVLDGQYPEESCRRLLDQGIRNDLLMKEWRGIHVFSRILPKNWFRCQLLAWMEMRKHKLWLEHWEEMRIDSAQWTDGKAQIRFTPSGAGSMKLICGITVPPLRAELDGKSVPFRETRPGRIEFDPDHGGTLTVVFSDDLKNS